MINDSCLHSETELGKTIMASGEFHLSYRCKRCCKNVTLPGPWLSKAHAKNLDTDNLPVFADYRVNNPPCEVCGTVGTELHHFGPKELFPDTFEKWPTAYLCKSCHNEWHAKITNPLRTLRKRESNDGKSNATTSPEISQ